MNYSDIEPLHDLEQNKNLDLILEHFKNHAPPTFPIRPIDKLGVMLKETNIQIRIDPNNTGLFKFLRNKLVADELIEQLPQVSGQNVQFQITYSGFFFKGYVTSYHKMSQALFDRKDWERSQKSTSRQMVVVTVLIAIGTLVAAIYYVQQINWYFLFGF